MQNWASRMNRKNRMSRTSPDEPDEPDELDELPNGGILYLLEDMRELELYGSVCAVVSVCDSMNYILEEADLREVFSRVHEYLEEDGVFIFDLNTVYKYRDLLGETTIAENREEGSFIWENYFDEASAVNEYDLTLYIREDGETYRRFEEVHYQRAYDLKTIDRLLAGCREWNCWQPTTRSQRSRSRRIRSGSMWWRAHAGRRL